MNRLWLVRLLLLSVATGLAILLGLLVHRAIESAEAEERGRRQAIADTAFASVERELSALLAREESRAWDEWRHLRVPEGEVQGSEGLVRSPLAKLPDEAFLLGWFQVEPDGTVGTPLVPQEDLAAALTLGSPTPVARTRDAELRDWVSDWLAARPPRPSRPAPPAEIAALDETSQDRIESYGDFRSEAPAAGAAPSVLAESVAPSASSSAPSKERRAAKKSYSARRQETATLGKAEVFQKRAQSDVVQNVMQRKDGAFADADDSPQLALEQEELAGRHDEAGSRGRAALPEGEAKQVSDDETGRAGVNIEVEAFVGELDAAGHLVLHRLVLVAGVPYRQGLVLDVRELAAKVDPLELLARTAETAGTFALSAGAAPEGAFERRLPAPFDSLRATLRLDVPEGMNGARQVVLLATLLAALGLAAFISIERMVTLTLAYAQRRSDFISAVTHELKTPLAAIRLHGEMLHEGIAATEQKRQSSYRTITAECDRLTRLVDNVLELSQLEKGTRSVHLVAGPLEPILREALAILEPHASSAGFEIDLEVEKGLEARFDRDALLQVVFNLVDNGLKYARESDDKRIELIARRDGDRVALLVRDHGPGVPPRHLRRIFEPFWRGERELTRRNKGTGIGLALVQGLVERMQGEVSGRNPADGGFEVRVTLPGAQA